MHIYACTYTDRHTHTHTHTITHTHTQLHTHTPTHTHLSKVDSNNSATTVMVIMCTMITNLQTLEISKL